ncbi:THUMP domain-containing protein [Candidatus Woesearchaeota archaeon]|nr:THUMP domain-containing protein [Candidatus Woesearchaeota archaeon]
MVKRKPKKAAGKGKATSKKRAAVKRTAKKAPARKAAKRMAKRPAKPGRKAPVKKQPKPVMARVLTAKANMLVTYDPNHKGTAEAEIKEAFGRIGERYELMDTPVEGLFKLKTQDARRVAKKLSDLSRREHQVLSTTHKYIPIDLWCKSDLPAMQKAVKALVPNIGQNERWKMGLNKRHWDKMHLTELIIKLTDVIDRPKVDLEKPEKIVQVEIIGEESGIALLRPDEFLDVVQAKL